MPTEYLVITLKTIDHGTSQSESEILKRAEGIRQEQIKFLGSEAMYIKVDSKLKKLEVDPFFYVEQLRLFGWRHDFIFDDTRFNHKEICQPNLLAFIVTQSFDQFVKMTESELVAINQGVPQEAMTKFGVPIWCFKKLKQLRNHEELAWCTCPECLESRRSLRIAFTTNPETIALTELEIRNIDDFQSAPKSLKEICMRKVLEFELDEDTLPLTVKVQLKTGPFPKMLKEKPKRMLEQLHNLAWSKQPNEPNPSERLQWV